MNPNNSIQYLMEAHLSAYKTNDSPQDSSFSTEYNLLPVKELSCSDKMQENLTLYEIAIDDIFMNLDKSLAKSTDFLQRCAYRYDGLQICVDNMGSIEVKNKQTLSKQWETIRSLLQDDYKGALVDDYVRRINNIMDFPEAYSAPTTNYFYCGLMFLGIPYATSSGWNRKRQVMLSDFDDVILEETLWHEVNVDDNRCFSITGKAFGNSNNYRVNKFYGRAQVSKGSIFPGWVQLEVDYTIGELNAYWKYELTRQEKE